MSGNTRVLALAAVVALAAAALIYAARDLPVIYPDLQLRWFHLSIGFFVSELTVVHLRCRRDAHSFSMSEIPLVIGFFFAAPLELVLGQLIGKVAGEIRCRRIIERTLVLQPGLEPGVRQPCRHRAPAPTDRQPPN